MVLLQKLFVWSLVSIFSNIVFGTLLFTTQTAVTSAELEEYGGGSLLKLTENEDSSLTKPRTNVAEAKTLQYPKYKKKASAWRPVSSQRKLVNKLKNATKRLERKLIKVNAPQTRTLNKRNGMKSPKLPPSNEEKNKTTNLEKDVVAEVTETVTEAVTETTTLKDEEDDKEGELRAVKLQISTEAVTTEAIPAERRIEESTVKQEETVADSTTEPVLTTIGENVQTNEQDEEGESKENFTTEGNLLERSLDKPESKSEQNESSALENNEDLKRSNMYEMGSEAKEINFGTKNVSDELPKDDADSQIDDKSNSTIADNEEKTGNESNSVPVEVRKMGENAGEGTDEKAEYNPTFNLIEPIKSSDKMDVFRYIDNVTDYHIFYQDLSWTMAKRYCEEIKGTLAEPKTKDEAFFMAEALAEVDVNIDTVWIGGRRTPDEQWVWDINKEPLTDVKIYFLNRANDIQRQKSHNCLAFTRTIHDHPLFVDLDCSHPRPFVCETQATQTRSLGASTPNDWIELNGRKYKIFYDRVKYDDAALKCFEHEQKSHLAYIDDFKTAQVLGRFLMIGRPSLENAWIGLKWSDELQSWAFTEEQQKISDKTGNDNFPPWRPNRANRRKGCGLLDRHVSNITVFLEARCDRLRPYICMIPGDVTARKAYLNIESKNMKYTFYLQQETWHNAIKICNSSGSKLTEPKSDTDIMNYIEIMADNVTYTRHMWIGGVYKNGQWLAPSDNTPITNINPEYWVANNTYYPNLEDMNTCLNIDRDGHYTPLLYGTVCEEKQSFLCETSKENEEASDKEPTKQ